MQIDQDIRIRLLEFDQPRSEPECAQSLGDGNADLAGQGIRRRIAGAQYVEGSRLHLLHGGDHQRAFVGQTGAVDVAGEQRSAGLAFEIIDPAANGVDRQRQALGRRAETSASDNFQENARRIPVREAADVCLWAFLQWNAPFRQGVHTSPFGSLNWQNLAQTTTTAGWGTTSFERHPYYAAGGIRVLPGLGTRARNRANHRPYEGVWREFRCEP